MPRLVLYLKDSEQDFELGTEAVTCGRSAANQMPIQDEQASREHCRFELDAGQWYVVDLGSSNGTLVDGRRVSREPLADGAEVQIGQARIIFVDEAAAQPATTPVSLDLSLRATGGPCDGQVFKIQKSFTRVGRKAQNDIVLEDTAVSGYHAEIIVDGSKTRIIDKNSRNGVRVNRVRITERELDHGDEITIGSTTLRFVRGIEEEKPAAPGAPGAVAPAPAEGAPALPAGASRRRRPALLLVAVLAFVVLAAVAYLVLPLISPGPKDYPGNLLAENTSFESAGPGIPGWVVAKGTASEEPADAADGSAALRLASTSSAGRDVSALCWSAEVPVSRGRRYDLSAWVKNTASESVALCVAWHSREHPWLLTLQLGRHISDAATWRRETETFTPPAWATAARFGCAVIGQGAGRFDGFCLLDAGAAPEPARLTAGRLALEPASRGELVALVDSAPAFGRLRLALTVAAQPLVQSLGTLEPGYPQAGPAMIKFAGKIGLDGKVLFTEALSTDGDQLTAAYDLRVPPAADSVVAVEFLSDRRALRDVTLETVRGISSTESAPFENKTDINLITFFSGKDRAFLALSDPATVTAWDNSGDSVLWRLEFPGAVRGDRAALTLAWSATTAEKDALVDADLRRAEESEAAEEFGKTAKMYQDFIAKYRLRTADRAEASRRLKALRSDIAARVTAVEGLMSRARLSQDDADFAEAERAAETLVEKLKEEKAAEGLAQSLAALRTERKSALEKRREKEAAGFLAQATQHVERKEYNTARVILKYIVEKFPDTKAAKDAPDLLKTLPPAE